MWRNVLTAFGARLRDSSGFRVATFNIRHCLGTDGRIDVQRVAEVIVATRASIIALQEVDVGMPRSGRVDQAAELSHLTGLEFDFHATLRRRGGRFGLALAGGASSDLIRFPRLGSHEPRAAIMAGIDGITVIATHLSAAPEPRPAEIEALANLAAGIEGPVIVMGDLNAPVRALGPLTGLGFRPTSHRVSLPGRVIARHIDHVLAGPGLVHRASFTIPTDASDHRPLVADLSLDVSFVN